MRMNTRNLILIGVGVVVMAALIFFGTQQSEAPADEPTETAAETGPLFPDLAAEDVVRLEVRGLDQSAGERNTPTPTPTATQDAPPPTATPLSDAPAPPIEPGEVVIEKDAENFWTITEATSSADRDTDQLIVVGVVDILAGLEYADRFSVANVAATLSEYGLDNPAYEIVLVGEDTTYTLRVGGQNPGGRRYYTQLATDDETVYLVPTDILSNVLDYTTAPPYVAPPTATPTPFPTANPFSEVEQTATAQAEFDLMATAQAEAAAAATDVEAGPAPAADESGD